MCFVSVANVCTFSRESVGGGLPSNEDRDPGFEIRLFEEAYSSTTGKTYFSVPDADSWDGHLRPCPCPY